MKRSLPDSVISPNDVQGLLLELHDYARWHSHNSVKKQLKAGHTADAPELSHQAHDLLRSWSNQEPITTRMLDKHLRALEDFGRRAPRMTITLAAPAPASLKQTLTAWCRQNLSPDILVNFEFNSTLCGGMVVRYGSRILDWSFRRQILESSKNFPEILRNV